MSVILFIYLFLPFKCFEPCKIVNSVKPLHDVTVVWSIICPVVNEISYISSNIGKYFKTRSDLSRFNCISVCLSVRYISYIAFYALRVLSKKGSKAYIKLISSSPKLM